ncbi:hypothetical protein GCM10025876_22620 [Demequina litorisediminis]|uniref:Uncharacterized protein n=1 Tax=Demequina litorisediminis TaxID=1849022 RepID=A0ABQ6IFZ4_9MICO|nr:hypothetical protein GCM10025876_22620 [Demequina litorisediminis]
MQEVLRAGLQHRALVGVECLDEALIRGDLQPVRVGDGLRRLLGAQEGRSDHARHRHTTGRQVIGDGPCHGLTGIGQPEVGQAPVEHLVRVVDMAVAQKMNDGHGAYCRLPARVRENPHQRRFSAALTRAGSIRQNPTTASSTVTTGICSP